GLARGAARRSRRGAPSPRRPAPRRRTCRPPRRCGGQVPSSSRHVTCCYVSTRGRARTVREPPPPAHHDMLALLLGRTPRILAACIAFCASTLFAGLAGAATLTYSVALDTDSSAATGCTMPSANGPLAGIDRVLDITITTSGANATVGPVAMRSCSSGALGSPSTIDAGGWAVGIGEGSGGADVIEAALPLSLLPPAATIRAIVLADDGAGGNDATAPFTIVLAAAPPPPPRPSIPVPLSPWLIVALGIG